MQYKVPIFFDFLYATPPRLGSDGERADGGLKATAAGTVCLQTRAVARRRFQTSGRRHRNRSGGFCCFSPSKSREKSFPELYAESSRGFRKVAVFTNFFLSCTFGAKSTKSLRTSFSAGLREPRRCTGRARSSLCATPWRTRRSPPSLFPRQTRVRNYCAAAGGSRIFIWQCAPAFFLPARRFPTWFRWRKSVRRAESESGGDGLLANPRIVARRRFLPFGRRHRNRSGGFCCFSPPKSREKSFPELYAERSRGFRKIAVFTNFFLLVLLGPKVPKASARRSLRECASRGAARGAQDQAYAPPRDGRAAARTLFFRVKRECGFVVPPLAAFFLYGNAPLHSFFPQGDPRLGSDGGKADGRLKAPAAGTVCL